MFFVDYRFGCQMFICPYAQVRSSYSHLAMLSMKSVVTCSWYSCSTSEAMQNVLNSLNVNKALVVTKENNANVVLSARNIPSVKTALVNTINVYDVMKYNTVVLTKDAVAAIEEVYA